jgi:hypothetical protein
LRQLRHPDHPSRREAQDLEVGRKRTTSRGKQNEIATLVRAFLDS